MKGRGWTRRRWIIGTAAALALMGVGAPFVYSDVIQGPAPAKLALPTDPSHLGIGPTSSVPAHSSGGGTIAGVWNAGVGSAVGYRVQGAVLGFRQMVVGRTTKVWGSITISGPSVSTGSFTVDMASVTSTASQRKVLDVAADPTATFVLTKPVDVANPPADGAARPYTATGTLTLHGTTRPVTFTLSGERIGSAIYVLADIPIAFADWNISAPYGLQSPGTLEVLLGLTKGAANSRPTATSGSTNTGTGGPATPSTTNVSPLTIPAH
jgi:polyisoprenoid-binding protein YceI